ncbi:Pepco domain-containing protein [Thermoleptolyngbya sp.]
MPADFSTSSEADLDVIWVITEAPASPNVQTDGQRGGWGGNPFGEPGFAGRTQRTPVSTDALEQNMSSFLSRMGRVLNRARQSAAEVAGMELEEIVLSVEVSGEGQVNLLGTGGRLGTSGGMTLTFRAKPSA